MGNLGLTTVATNQNQKETTINNADARIESALTEVLTVSLASGNGTITTDQMQTNIGFIGSGHTVARDLTVPQTERTFWVKNAGTSAGVISIKRGTTTLTLAIGAYGLYYTDGTANGLELLALSGAPADIQALLDGISTTQGTILYRNAADWVALSPGVVAVAATGTLTAAANVSNNDTVSIGYAAGGSAEVYTFKTALTPIANEVLIGATASDSIDNLIAAINGGAGSGTLYAAGTVTHTDVTAATGSGDTMVLTAETAGTAANSITTTEAAAQLSWGSATLTGGVDAEFLMTNGSGQNPSWEPVPASGGGGGGGAGGPKYIVESPFPSQEPSGVTNSGAFGSRGGVLVLNKTMALKAAYAKFTADGGVTYQCHIVTLDSNDVVLSIVDSVTIGTGLPTTADMVHEFEFPNVVTLTAGVRYGLIFTRNTTSGSSAWTMWWGNGQPGYLWSADVTRVNTRIQLAANTVSVSADYAGTVDSAYWFAVKWEI
jgi:hypothetical protein